MNEVDTFAVIIGVSLGTGIVGFAVGWESHRQHSKAVARAVREALQDAQTKTWVTSDPETGTMRTYAPSDAELAAREAEEETDESLNEPGKDLPTYDR